MENEYGEISDISNINISDLDTSIKIDNLNEDKVIKKRKKVKIKSAKSDTDLIAEFLANNKIKKCPTSYAEGALSKGHWEF